MTGDGERPGTVLQGRRAGFVTRLIADTIDIAVLLSAGGAVLLFSGVIAFLIHPGTFAIPSPPEWVELLVSVLLVFGYLGYGWSGPGRSLGKQIAGLRVVDTAGQVLSVRRAVVRVFACLMFPAGLLWCLVSRRSASLQDVVLRTAVIYDWSRSHQQAGTWEATAGAPDAPPRRAHAARSSHPAAPGPGDDLLGPLD